MSFAVAKTSHVQAVATAGATARAAVQTAEKAPAPARDRLSLTTALHNPAAYNRAIIANIGHAEPIPTGRKIAMALGAVGGAVAGGYAGRYVAIRAGFIAASPIAALGALAGAATLAAGITFVARQRHK